MNIRKGLLGTKLGMTQIFNENGKVIPVTAIKVGPCVITQVKTVAKDGYSAIQVGFGEKREKNMTKPEIGNFKKKSLPVKRYVKEFRIAEADEATYKVGDILSCDLFNENQIVDVIGTSKGKGYAGVMKRHNFKGAHHMSHGTHEFFRHGGSIGCRERPGRVVKGRKMAGHLGNVRVTVQNLTVAKILKEENIVLLQGAIPGANGNLVVVRAGIKA